MLQRFLFLCIPIALFGCIRTCAQSSSYSVPGYSVLHFTDENGLPQNSIKNINIDHSGYIWLATEAGLVRYDGKKFRLLSKEEMGVHHPRIYMMGRSPLNGQLYALSEESDEVEWKESSKKQVFYPLPDAFSDTQLSAWHGHSITSSVLHTQSTFPQGSQVHLLLNATPDSFYILTPDQVTFRTPQKIVWQTPIRQNLGDVFFCLNKRLYMYTPQGNFEEITSRGTIPALQVPHFKKLVRNPGENQNFVVTHQNRVYELEQDASGQLRLVLLLEDFPPDFEINCLFHIKKQILFIGSNMLGLLVCKKHQFNTLATDLPNQQSIQYAVFPLNDSSILTARKDLVYKSGAIAPPHFGPATPETYNRSVTQTRNGTYLIAQNDSVLAYSPQGRLLKTLGFRSLTTALYTDPQNRTWVASVDGGLFLLDDSLSPTKRFVFPSKQYVNYILGITDSVFLVGTRNGLFGYSLNNPHILPYPQTRGYNVRSLFQSKSGKIYLCTYGDGLLMLTPKGPVLLPKDKAGYLNTAHCMQQDSKGRMWITTNKGLFYTDETNLILYAEGKASRVYYHYIDKSSGFKTNEFNGGCQPCGLTFASGEIVFPSMNGLVMFNPDSVITIQPTQKMAIEKIAVDEHFLPETADTVTVQRNFKRLEIYLTTPFYGAPENLVYEYTFDTTQTEAWIPIHSANGSIAFTSLPPGYSYISFRQKTMLGLGRFNYQTLVLYKPKAFWELTYFWVFCTVLVWIGIFFAIRLRTQTLKQRNRKLTETVDEAQKELLATIDKLENKTRFQQWLTSSIIHDLRGPLRFINFYAGDIQKETEETSPAQNKFLKSVYFSALKIYNYSDNLVQLLRIEQTSDFPPEKTDFMNLVEDKIDQFREQAKWNNITLYLDPDSDPFIYVNKAALSIIIQNLLDNSIKNLKDGTIYLSLKNSEQHSVVEIRDEGPGLPPDLLWKFNHGNYDEIARQNGSGLGLWLVKSLMVQTGGHIRFQNLPQKGLHVTLTWDLTQ